MTRILIVDDDDAIRNLFGQMLEKSEERKIRDKNVTAIFSRNPK